MRKGDNEQLIVIAPELDLLDGEVMAVEDTAEDMAVDTRIAMVVVVEEEEGAGAEEEVVDHEQPKLGLYERHEYR